MLIERAGRLIGQEQVGLRHHGARDGHALLLPAGKLVGIVVQLIAQAYQFQHLPGALRALCAAYARVHQGQLHVFLRRHAGQKLKLLKDKADLPRADARQFLFAQRADQLPIQDVFARSGRIQAADQVHQRGFAAARGAQDGKELARLNVQVDPLQNHLFFPTHAVGFHNVPHPEKFTGHGL